jgi:tricorn protease
MPFAVFNYAIAPDNRTIVFATSEPAGQRNVPVVYSISEDGRRLTRITSGAPPGGDEAGGPPGRGGGGGFGGGIGSFSFSRDGRTLFFKEGPSIYTVAMPGGGGAAAAGGFAGAGGGGGAASAAGGGARRQIRFTAKVSIDRPAEWAEMFDDAWRTMKYQFYDPQMHGKDWDGARAKYQPLVEYVGERQELINIINEMIGELNASHTARPASGDRAARRVAFRLLTSAWSWRPTIRQADTKSPTYTRMDQPTRTGSRWQRATTSSRSTANP